MCLIVPAADPCQDVCAMLGGGAEQLEHAVCFLQVQTLHQGAAGSLNKDTNAGTFYELHHVECYFIAKKLCSLKGNHIDEIHIEIALRFYI